MVETIGICDKHELPLDKNGECELCRLSNMPSKAPPAGSGVWAVVIPVLVLVAGALWAYGSLGRDDDGAAVRGVQRGASPAREEPAAADSEKQGPERVPPRSNPPPPEEIPRPDDIR